MAAALIIGACVGCAPAEHPAGTEPVIIERLYFGRHANGQLAVSMDDWRLFLDEVVTPRFPDGLTTWPAQGQWRGANGKTETESSFVLEIIHARGAPGTDAKIEALISEYKTRFHQEAVLRVVAPARAGF